MGWEMRGKGGAVSFGKTPGGWLFLRKGHSSFAHGDHNFGTHLGDALAQVQGHNALGGQKESNTQQGKGQPEELHCETPRLKEHNQILSIFFKVSKMTNH